MVNAPELQSPSTQAEAAIPVPDEERWHQLYYEQWVQREGLDLLQGWVVKNVYTAPLKPWARVGGNAVHIQLEGTGGLNAAQIVEIPPARALEPQKHLYEELIYILQGRGTTQVSYPGQAPHTFEWGPGSLFAIPLNASFQLFNASGREAARYISVTSAPIMMNLLRSEEALFNAPLTFPDRYTPEPSYFSDERREIFRNWGPDLQVVFSNLIPDVNRVELNPLPRGKGTNGIMFELANGVLASHVLEMPGGVLTKLHRHGPGAHVLWLEGEGYTMLGAELTSLVREDWGPGTLLVPPSGWWHQHSVITSAPARHLALKIGGRVNSIHKLNRGTVKSTREGGSQLDYNDVPAAVREQLWNEFIKSCQERGTEPQMQEIDD